MEKKYCSLDLFAGAGGMSLGAEAAGITTKVAIESDKNASKTFAKNFPGAKIINKDIREVNIKDEIPESPFVIFGGPPCRGFSLSNSKTRNDDNPLNSLFYEFLKFVDVLRPKWVVFENVEGFKMFGDGKIVKILCDNLEIMGYCCNYSVVTASDYGVPQNRRRFILVANKIGVDFVFPNVNNSKVSVNEALLDLPSLKNGDFIEQLPYKSCETNSYIKLMRGRSKVAKQNFVSRNQDYVIERYKYIKQGGNWKSIPEALMTNYKDRSQCHSGIYKRLKANEPSVVISNYRKNMLIHPFENRGLSVREASRLQSFPDNFVFEGSLISIQQQIGNAVPPLLAKAIFKQIIKLTEQRDERT